jgi:hypothetical protein
MRLAGVFPVHHVGAAGLKRAGMPADANTACGSEAGVTGMEPRQAGSEIELRKVAARPPDLNALVPAGRKTRSARGETGLIRHSRTGPAAAPRGRHPFTGISTVYAEVDEKDRQGGIIFAPNGKKSRDFSLENSLIFLPPGLKKTREI